MTALSPSGNPTNSITSLPHLGDQTVALPARLRHSTLASITSNPVTPGVVASASRDKVADLINVRAVLHHNLREQ
jgi:hypothetical protein